MRDVLPCRSCGALCRVAQEPAGGYVLLDAVPTSISTGQPRFSMAGVGRVVRTYRDVVAFNQHAHAPAVGRAPDRPLTQ